METKWISVKKKMPDNGGRKLLYISNRNYQWIQTGIIDYSECEWFVDNEDMDVYELGEGERVTHWMELPEPPKE